jgi:hypothetical protein
VASRIQRAGGDGGAARVFEILGENEALSFGRTPTDIYHRNYASELSLDDIDVLRAYDLDTRFLEEEFDEEVQVREPIARPDSPMQIP